MSFRRALLMIAALSALAAPTAFAADAGAATGNWASPIAAAIAIGIAAFGGALGQGRASAAALDGIARNPAAQGKIFIPMIVALALIESLVIYALIIAFAVKG